MGIDYDLKFIETVRDSLPEDVSIIRIDYYTQNTIEEECFLLSFSN